MGNNNSKVILAVVAAVVIIGAGLAIRNLTGPADESGTEDVRRRGESDSETNGGSSSIDGDGKTRVGRINSSDDPGSRRETDGGRTTIKRGESAAAIEVTPATTTTAQMEAARRRAEAMADEETTETEDNSREIADLVSRFLNETDPEARIELADELGLIDDPESIRKLLELLQQEQDPEVQMALLEAMQALDALESTSGEVLRGVQDILARTTDPDVRIAAQDLLGDLGTPEAVAALRDMRNNTAADPAERLNAAENLMRIRAIDPDLISAQEAASIIEQLKLDYQAGPDAAFRSQAIMALAIDGRENLPFFQQSLTTEQDPQVRNLLERLIRMFTAQQPQAPPPGTAVTPAPTP